LETRYRKFEGLNGWTSFKNCRRLRQRSADARLFHDELRDRENMPKLNELKAKYKPSGLTHGSDSAPRHEADTDLEKVKKATAERSDLIYRSALFDNK